MAAVVLAIGLAFFQTAVPDMAQAHAPDAKASGCFYEDFSRGAARWETSHMGVVNGQLMVKDASICTAVLKGEPAAFWQDQEIAVVFSMSDFLDGWFQVNFRNDGQSAEKLLLRKSGLVRLLPSGNEQALCQWALEDGRQYTLQISAEGDAVDMTLSDMAGTVLATAQYGGAILQTGAVGLASFNQNATVSSVQVVDTGEGLKLSETSVALTCGEQLAIDAGNAQAVMWDSSDPAVAAVDETGTVTALEPGVATITASSGQAAGNCTVVVTRPLAGMELSETDCTLYVGENFSVSALIPTDADASALLWSSSNPQVASLFGSGYTGRTICAKREGVAVVRAGTAAGDVSAVCRIRVVADTRTPQVSEAMFAVSDEGIGISGRKFGTAHEYSNRRPTAQAALQDIGFDFMRTFGAEEYDDGFFDLANGAGIPQMVAVPVIGRTAEEILSDVKKIQAGLVHNQPLYIELGNEVYDNGYASASEYMDACRKAYRAIKAYDDTILVGAVIISEEYVVVNPDGMLGQWNEIVAQNPDCYDAVIAHHYVTFNSIDGMTQSQMQDTIHLWNAYHRYAVETYAAQFPGKELWVTEYGTFYAAVFKQSDSTERARMGMGKSFGVALGNLEQAMDLLTSGQVDMCAYHILEDSQGFGMVQGETRLPNYYMFKEISTLLQENRVAYPVEPLYCKTHTVQSPAIRGGTFFDVQDIEAWGLGGQDGVRYIMFLNKSSNPAEVTVQGKQLQAVWRYEGELFDEYLTKDGNFTDAPADIAVPAEVYETPAKAVTLAGYSAAVCAVTDAAPALDAVLSVSGGSWDFEKDQPFTITFSSPVGNLAGADVTVEEDGVVQTVRVVQTGEGQYQIAPVGGWQFDSRYTVTLHGGVTATDGQILQDSKTVAFSTPANPAYAAYASVFTETFDQGAERWDCWNWKVVDGRLYKQDSGISTATIRDRLFADCTLSFEMELPPAESDGYAAVLFQGGSLRFYPQTGIIRSYFHGDNDAPFGTFDAPDGKIAVKIHMVGTKAEVYVKTAADYTEQYIGEIPYLEIEENTIAFQGLGQFYLDNVTVRAAETGISKIRCCQEEDGQTVWLERPVAGVNIMEVWLGEDAQEPCVLLGVSMKDGSLCAVAAAEEKEPGRYTLTMEVGEGEEVSLFLWESLANMTPLCQASVL